MLIDSQKLYKYLQELSLVDKRSLDDAFALSQTKKIPLSKILLEKDIVSDKNLGKIVADLLNLPFVNLTSISISQEILRIIPEVVAKKQKIIAFKKDRQGLHLAMVNPGNLEIIEFIKKKAGIPVIPNYATEQDLTNALNLYRKGIQADFDEIIKKSIEKAIKGKEIEAPIVQIVDTIIAYAYQNKASDIHIEPLENEALFRFRIDGVLHDIISLSSEIHPRVVTRIKVLSKLRTDEHQAAQDGKMRFKTEKENLDIRVSIVPITNGEKVVMRLLSEASRQFSFSSLGFSETDLAQITKAYKEPHGMILTTGPSGCGKTTTLYAILKILNKRDVNITTIEDPIEYDIQGVNQIQVNLKSGLTFDNGLRSIVRQDPNIILVGEIRDEKTAHMAINAAMTGHLVLSSLHANNACTAIPRFLEMNVQPFLAASSVNVIIAQRLVRTICSKCRVSSEINANDLKKYLDEKVIAKHFGINNPKVRVYQGKGCPVCHETGYAGRIGIFEVLLMKDNIRQAIIDRKDVAAIQEVAIKNNLTTMVDDGLKKIKQGITTLEEVLREIKE